MIINISPKRSEIVKTCAKLKLMSYNTTKYNEILAYYKIYTTKTFFLPAFTKINLSPGCRMEGHYQPSSDRKMGALNGSNSGFDFQSYHFRFRFCSKTIIC